MVAVMLPSAAPLVLLYRRGATARATVALATGYLLVWAATGLPVWVAMGVVPLWAGPAVLALAGAYQFTPFKAACLTRCRTPADFLVQRWGRSALRLGVEHGAWCVGCCWALMLVLVLAGMMGLAWVAGVTAIVALEKLHPRGQTLSRWTGALLLAGAVVQGVWLWLRASASMPMPGM
jgi:predicted metal-binding membrane protein